MKQNLTLKTLISKIELKLFLIFILSVIFFVYSFSQVDLNLTLSSNFYYLEFQKFLTYLGYFERSLSSLIYLFLLFLICLLYFLLIYQSKKQLIESSKVVKWMLTISFTLILAYPAFSYDIFNYIFDARIFATHGLNPYTHTALDFPHDEWTRFMRWTHRTYPYGPSWILITIPVYMLGFGKFILTLASFKIMFWINYLVACFSIYKVLEKTQPKSALFGLLLFGLNPLVLIEGLLSPHLDMTMTSLMLLGILLSLHSTKFKLYSWFLLFLSAGIKYVSGAVLPGFLLWRFKKISFIQMIYLSIGLSYLVVLIIIFQREILPWYVLVPFGLSALVPQNRLTTTLLFSLTPSLLIRYYPFLRIGDYTKNLILERNLLTIICFTIGFIFFWKTFKYFNEKI